MTSEMGSNDMGLEVFLFLCVYKQTSAEGGVAVLPSSVVQISHWRGMR